MTHPQSLQRLLGFDRTGLPVDINGQPDGPEYDPFLDFPEMHIHRSLVSGINGIWSGRVHKLASKDEFEIFLSLEGNPYILSIREGYVLIPDDVLADVLAGKPVHRNRVMTIDFVLTLRSRNFGGPLRYRGLSSKPPTLAERDAGKRRASKEEVKLASIGWEWGYVGVPKPLEVANYMKLRNWAKAYPLDEAARDAAQLAALFYRSTSNKCLDRQLAAFGKRLGIAPEDRYFVFAGACYLGYLALNHEQKLGEECLPALEPPARTASGWMQHGS